MHNLKKRKKRKVICDIEGNSLKPTLIHCIVCRDIESKEVFKFRPNTPMGGHFDFGDSFIEFAKEVDVWIGHNFIGYDMLAINRLIGRDLKEPLIKLEKVIDTLVLSRLFRPVTPLHRIGNTYNRNYGHSLEAWGNYLKCAKTDFNDWEKFSETMLKYCEQDTLVNLKIYEELWNKERDGFSDECIELEHKVAYMLKEQEENGFYLDKGKAYKLQKDTNDLLDLMNSKLQSLFPPEFKLVRNLPIKLKKDGTYGSVFLRIKEQYSTNENLKIEKADDTSYNLFMKEVFNPQSGKHIAERLLGLGWKPKNFTAKGNIKTDKKSLEQAIKELLEENEELEELRCLSDYSIVADRNQKVNKWLELAKEDGRVHGKVNPIGAGTHRCSHYDDNMANIASVTTKSIKKKTDPKKFEEVSNIVSTMEVFSRFDKNKILLHKDDEEIEFALTGLEGTYGWDSRDCWAASSPEYCIVGADASGIQLRALAHYMNDSDYTKKLLESDIHVVNQKAAGISTRPISKTFIYAWLLGGGDWKIGSIVGVATDEYDSLFTFARNRRQWGKSLLQHTIDTLRKKGLRADKKTVATIIKGLKTKEQFLDRTPALKRLKKKDIPEVTKKGYLIGLDGRKLWIPNEHLAMSLYLQGFEAVIMKKTMVLYQTKLKELGIPFKQVAMVHDEFQIECLWEHAEIVGKAVVDAIRQAGIIYKSNCPLDGEYKIGSSWARTH